MEPAAEQIPLEAFLFVSAIIFSLGVYGVLARRNAVQILMSVELMLNAVAVNFVAFGVYTDPELFRGVIFGMLSRRLAPLWAALVSSGLFGFWHILPTLETVESNPVGGIFAGFLGLTIASVGAVVGTALAGMGFMWVRWRANSIVAPVLTHIATNSFAILAGMIVVNVLE